MQKFSLRAPSKIRKWPLIALGGHTAWRHTDEMTLSRISSTPFVNEWKASSRNELQFPLPHIMLSPTKPSTTKAERRERAPSNQEATSCDLDTWLENGMGSDDNLQPHSLMIQYNALQSSPGLLGATSYAFAVASRGAAWTRWFLDQIRKTIMKERDSPFDLAFCGHGAEDDQDWERDDFHRFGGVTEATGATGVTGWSVLNLIQL